MSGSITDVAVVGERATVGSGGTGTSSGIVRRHYGIPSPAAMANSGLDLFEYAADVLGTDIEFDPTGCVVGVGDDDVDALPADLATRLAVGVETGEIGRDAYRTAQGFAAAARRDGVRIRRRSRRDGDPLRSAHPHVGAGEIR